MRRVQARPRAARRSEWLRCALAHHHDPNPGVENEIVVLATGIDQYLQEVFHHLAYPSREDKVSAEDFAALCSVLGVREKTAKQAGDEDGDDGELGHVCSGLPCQLTFKDFHARLCGFFRLRDCGWRMPVTEETELVERQILLRWPRLRRRKDVAADGSKKAGDTESEELCALRELVEDLRSALQGSDARCLALEVALRRERGRTVPPSPTTVCYPTSSVSLLQGKLVPTRRIKGRADAGEGVRRFGRRWETWDPLFRELKLIRSSRDGQLEEAIKFNERLERELRWAYQEVRARQAAESALRRENNQIRRRAEEAREALSLGLDRVRRIQEQAESVPQLQSRISQLQMELEQYRFSCVCLPDAAPTRGVASYPKTDAECLQRAVEGRAASDEEEEGQRGAVEQGQRCPLEAKKHIHPPDGCAKGCQSRCSKGQQSSESEASRGRCSWPGLNQELEEEKSTTEDAKTGLEEKERARLSLLESKFRDSLLLLLQLRNKKVSRRELGTMVMETLDMCSNHGDGPSEVLQVADSVYMHLSSRDCLGQGGGAKGGTRESKQSSATNPLIISC
ncbi:EF-hand and coiled-coil domain-containing protein 1 [Nerophis ophidion]|uniref:EF-hand and coiled-coil domain-containing protein 1 n=1 Tax=Nerophis ophidion TaxID=159077 RepID=UPI002AE08DC8|nr:EF-hand and coiled-coil domain-containing protein 1 [Nerophis ophidion]